MKKIKEFCILMVDDDDHDVAMVQRTIKNTGIDCHLEVVEGSGYCLSYLSDEDSENEKPLPDMIFMDMYMPVMNGLECIASIKKIEAAKDIPIILFTDLDSPDFASKADSLKISLLKKSLFLENGAKILMGLQKAYS
jgi:CheY-like chemotaxis protein